MFGDIVGEFVDGNRVGDADAVRLVGVAVGDAVGAMVSFGGKTIDSIIVEGFEVVTDAFDGAFAGNVVGAMVPLVGISVGLIIGGGVVSFDGAAFGVRVGESVDVSLFGMISLIHSTRGPKQSRGLFVTFLKQPYNVVRDTLSKHDGYAVTHSMILFQV